MPPMRIVVPIFLAMIVWALPHPVAAQGINATEPDFGLTADERRWLRVAESEFRKRKERGELYKLAFRGFIAGSPPEKIESARRLYLSDRWTAMTEPEYQRRLLEAFQEQVDWWTQVTQLKGDVIYDMAKEMYGFDMSREVYGQPLPSSPDITPTLKRLVADKLFSLSARRGSNRGQYFEYMSRRGEAERARKSGDQAKIDEACGVDTVRFLWQAGANGYPSAVRELVVAYLDGPCHTRDDAKAYFWSGRAQQLGLGLSTPTKARLQNISVEKRRLAEGWLLSGEVPPL